MCVGHTHSGKTTFAQKLVQKIPDIAMIDSDEIAAFLNTKYPLITDSQYNKTKSDVTKSGLKGIVFKDVYTFALKTGVGLVLSNGNLSKAIRSFVISNAKKHGYQVVLVYFNFPKEIILERLKNSNKNTNVFIISKNWQEVFERQEKIAEFPPSKRGVTYFEMKSPEDEKIVLENIEKLWT